jgi:hypothetical protein
MTAFHRELIYPTLMSAFILWMIPVVLLPRRTLNRHLFEGMAVLTCEWFGMALFDWRPPALIAVANFIYICWCAVRGQEANYGKSRQPHSS